jgi:hypothetical protein
MTTGELIPHLRIEMRGTRLSQVPKCEAPGAPGVKQTRTKTNAGVPPLRFAPVGMTGFGYASVGMTTQKGRRRGASRRRG